MKIAAAGGSYFHIQKEGIVEVNIYLFDDFEALDAMGPASVFGKIPKEFHINYVSATGNIVNSMQGLKVWTEPADPEKLDGILIIPGGRGARRLLYQDTETIKFLKKMATRSEICMMISNGSALLSQTGLLYRRKIAGCGLDENWKRMFTAGIYVVDKARWIADGKFYSSAESVSGISMALSIVADHVGPEQAEQIAAQLGYDWSPEAEDIYL